MTQPFIPLRFIRSPESTQDFSINWGPTLLGGDTIATSTWTADAGITIESSSQSPSTTTVWISGGTVPAGATGVTYHAVNTIVTTGGRTDERTLSLYTKIL